MTFSSEVDIFGDGSANVSRVHGQYNDNYDFLLKNGIAHAQSHASKSLKDSHSKLEKTI